MIAYLRRQLDEARRSIVNRRFASALDALSRAGDAVDHLADRQQSMIEQLREEFTEKTLFYDISKERELQKLVDGRRGETSPAPLGAAKNSCP